MLIDHSLTYRGRSLRNLPHRLRLREIERLIRRLALPAGAVYADFGCSDGFVTARVSEWIGAGRTFGFDHVEEYVERARNLHPTVTFAQLDLNDVDSEIPKCHFATCFETLEHVGDLDAAITNLGRSLDSGAQGLISVPIEIGWRGLLKFLAKVLVYGYGLGELPQRAGLARSYFVALLTGRRISRFRDKRNGWGTHFGFDYRDLDEALTRHGLSFNAHNRGFTRFYIIKSDRIGQPR